MAYRIAGKFRGSKVSRIDKHEDFAEKTFADFCCRPDTACARMRCSRRKLLRTGREPRNSWKFSPSKVSRYTVYVWPMLNVFEWALCSDISHGKATVSPALDTYQLQARFKLSSSQEFIQALLHVKPHWLWFDHAPCCKTCTCRYKHISSAL